MASMMKSLGDIFLFKRHPHFSMSIDWEAPATAEAMERELDNEGFIAKSRWQKEDLDAFPTVKQDLSDLEEHLLPTFWEFNQKARYFQNSFYYYQWVFMLGAFGTTILGALTTYAYTHNPKGSVFTDVFGFATAILSAMTGYYTYVSDAGKPQQRWANTRRLSEELRMSYFRYLAHLPPFDKEDRVQQMRRLVIQVRRKENENV